MFIGGNWKLNGDNESLTKLTQALVKGSEKLFDTRVVVFPPAVYLSHIIDTLKNSPIKVGAQNQCEQLEGAFTGEVSAHMLQDIGCDYVLLGHSERRHVYGETNEMINKKMRLAFEKTLLPVLCVGETLQQREAGNAQKVVLQQLQIAFDGLSNDEIANTVIAYEPVWAIGTGEVATPAQAQEMHASIREFLNALISDKARDVDIIYGGSVKPDNAAEIFSQADVDGGLIGGASLKADDFIAICKAAD